MRCPKCGYISFDHLSSCAKCSRNLADVAEDLQGTSMETDLSLFLGSVIEAEPSETELHEGDTFAAESDIDLTLEEEEPMLDLGEEAEADVLNVSEEELTLDIEEVPPIDLSGIGEEEQTDKTDKLFADAQGYTEEQGIKGPSVDLEGIDLSDLAPLEEAVEEEPALELEGETEAAAAPEETALELEDEAALELAEEEQEEVSLDLEYDEEAAEEPALKLEEEAEAAGAPEEGALELEEEAALEPSEEAEEEVALELAEEEQEEATLDLETEDESAEELSLEFEEEPAEEDALELGEEEEGDKEIELSDLLAFGDEPDASAANDESDSPRDPELDDDEEEK